MRLDYMTEEEWLARANTTSRCSTSSMEAARGSCAVERRPPCRRIPAGFCNKPQRDVILVAKRFADGSHDWAELERAAQAGISTPG